MLVMTAFQNAKYEHTMIILCLDLMNLLNNYYTVRHAQIISYGRRRVSLVQDYCILISVSLGLDLSVH